MWAKRILVLLLLFSGFHARSQSYIVEKYGDKQGLNHGVVYRVFQDSQGFVWASTDNGLNRFEGEDFSSLNDRSELISDYLFGMAEWKSGILFSSYNNGLVHYSFRDKRFRKSREFEQVMKPIDIYTHNDFVLVIDNVATLWIFKQGKLITRLNSVSSILKKDGKIYLARGKSGIQELILEGGHFSLKTILKGEEERFVIQVIPMKNGNWMVICAEDLLEFNPKTKDLFLLKGSEGLSMYVVGYQPEFRDSYETIWLGIPDGRVFQYDEEQQQLKLIFENAVVNQFFEDKNRNMWIATYGFGLWKIAPFRTKEYAFDGHLSTGFGVVSKGGSNFFVGHRQLYLPGAETRTMEDIAHFRKHGRTVNQQGVVYADDKQFFYCRKYKLYYNDWNNLTYEVELKSSDQRFLCSQIVPVNGNQFIIASRRGAFFFDKREKKTTEFKTLQNKIVYSVHHAGREVAFCTSDGVFIGNLKKLLPVHFPNPSKTESIRSVLLLNPDEMVVGSNKQIFYFDRRSGKKQVLCKEVFCSGIESAYGFVWALCDKGLIRIDTHTWKTDWISSDYGIPSWAKSMKVKDGKFYIMYRDKVLELSAEKLVRHHSVRKLDLYLDFVFFGEEELYSMPDNVSLQKPLRKAVFKFLLPRYMDMDNVRFFVKINDELEFEGSRKGRFNLLNLANGTNKYTFYAMDGNGKTIASKNYVIYNPYPLWRHPLVLLVYLGMIILVFGLIFSSRLRRLHKRKALELETNRLVYELKQKSLMNMLNPHFLNNAINSIQAFVVMNDQRKTLKYLSQFARLMRLNLELLNSSMVPLSKEVESIRFYTDFEQVRTSSKFDFLVVINASRDLKEFQVPSFIIQPFVENAIWHGILTTTENNGKGRIMLELEERKEDILICVRDNGIGIKKSLSMKTENALKISLGTQIIKERFEIFKKVDPHYGIQIIDKSESGGQGTLVKITVPKIITQEQTLETASHKK
ncbi:MAG: sensor histidine kinase [Fluviicola sp.]